MKFSRVFEDISRMDLLYSCKVNLSDCNFFLFFTLYLINSKKLLKIFFIHSARVKVSRVFFLLSDRWCFFFSFCKNSFGKVRNCV